MSLIYSPLKIEEGKWLEWCFSLHSPTLSEKSMNLMALEIEDVNVVIPVYKHESFEI